MATDEYSSTAVIEPDGAFPNSDELQQSSSQNLALPAPAATEIDVESVVESFRSKPLAVCTPEGFDQRVRRVPAAESAVVAMQTCPVCAGSRGEPLYQIDSLPFRLVVCTRCKTGQLHPRPAPEQIPAFYPPEYYGVAGSKFVPWIESLVRLVGSRHVRFLTQGLPAGARVLDIGCGRGVVLKTLAESGFRVHGFDISREATDGAFRRAQIRVAGDLKEADYPTDHFDEVILWHVLEHLTNPRETLLEIRRILRPGGRLALAVPNFSSLQARLAGPAWFHLDLPRHIFHFPARAVKELVEECGFAVNSVHHFSLRQNPFGWVQSALNSSVKLPRNGLYAFLKQQAESSAGRFDAETARKLRWAWRLGMPLGLAASVLAALLHNGASVAVMAETRKR